MIRYIIPSLRIKLWYVLPLVFLISCGQGSSNADEQGPSVSVDLQQIKQRGKLIALTGYNSTSYFIYRGKPMGYDYELLVWLAEDLGLDLEVVVVHDLDEIFEKLNNGEGDIIAYGFAITKDRQQQVAFTLPYNEVPQVLVQRKPDNWRNMMQHEIDETLIISPSELIGKTVYVRGSSSYFERLMNLTEEIGGEIDIATVSGNVSTEELIRKVAEKEIDYTVADQDIALISRKYLPVLDISTKISLPQRIAWAVRKNSPELLDTVNKWISQQLKSREFNVIYKKYYKDTRMITARVKSDYFSMTGGKISAYDEIIKEQAERINWDWRLLAAQIYQESRFKTTDTSWAGAKGLMQLMPATAERFGVTDRNDPAESIRGGTDYIKYLLEYWRGIPDSAERIKFVLASYNVGESHVADAVRLTEKFGGDVDHWNGEGNVADNLLKKSNPKFYNDPVVVYGYCRGKQPVSYVEEILEHYRHYRNFIEL